MKTRLLLTFLLIVSGILVFAQSLELSIEGEPLGPNAQISVEGSAASAEIVAYLTVTNTGGSSLDVLCQRYELDMVSGAQSAICWGGLCFPPNVSLSPLSGTIPSGSSNDEFSGHYYPNSNPGVSTIAFTFFDEDNPSDSVMVTVMYDGMTVGIDDPVAHKGIRIYPNPAGEQVTINAQDADMNVSLDIRMTDSKGALVLQQKLQSGSATLNTSELPAGLYFLNAYAEEQVVASEKILIKH